MKWYTSLTDILTDNVPGPSTGNLEKLRADLLENIYELYEVLLKYIVKIVCTLDRRAILNFLRNSIKLDDWAGQLAGVGKAETKVTATLDQFGAREANSYLKLLASKKLSEEQDSLMKKLYVADMRAETESLEQRKDQLLKACYDWVLDDDDFKKFTKWDDTSSNLFWIRGDPGKGKTMLFMGIVRELEEKQNTHLLAPSLSYFFCQKKDSRLNTATSVLRGLIWMLLRQERTLLSHLDAFKDHGEKPFEDPSTFWNLKRVFKAMIADSRLGRTYLAVDALDECIREKDTPGRDQLLELVAETSGPGHKIKWIVSSRNYPEIEEFLAETESDARLSLELNAAAVAKAVEAYIKFKVAELGGRLRKTVHGRQDAKFGAGIQKLEGDVAEEVRLKANRTFLWVALAFKQVERTKAPQVLDKIKQMPPDLYEFYEMILQHIQTSESVEECRKVLSVVNNVYRPLTLSELTVLAEIPELNVPEDIVLECGILTIEPNENVVSFVHQSAQDYLVLQPKEKGWSPILGTIFPDGFSEAHRQIFSLSLQTLQGILRRDIYDVHKPGASIEEAIAARSDPDPLEGLQYSTVNWIDHFCDYKHADKEEENADQELISLFLQDHLLYWLESLVLVGRFTQVTIAISKLMKRINVRQPSSAMKLNNAHTLKQTFGSPDDLLMALLQDAARLILDNREIIDQTPLQLYASTLAFAPEESVVRKKFWENRYKFIRNRMGAAPDWDPCLQIIQLSGYKIDQIAFSPDGSRLAVAIRMYSSGDNAIQVRDAITGHLQLLILIDGSDECTALHFGKASISWATKHAIHRYDSTTGTLQQKLAIDWKAWGQGTPSESIAAFNPDGGALAVRVKGSGPIHLIDTDKGDWVKVSSDHETRLSPKPSVLVSSDCLFFGILGLENVEIEVFDIKSKQTTAQLQTDCSIFKVDSPLEGYIELSLSPDQQHLAIATFSSVSVYNLSTVECETRIFRTEKGLLCNLVFFQGEPTIGLVMSNEIQTWDLKTEQMKGRYRLSNNRLNGQAILSPTSSILVHSDDAKRLAFSDLHLLPQGVGNDALLSTEVRLSPSGRIAASYSMSDSRVNLWDLAEGKLLRTLKGKKYVHNVAISADDQVYAVYALTEASFWDLNSDNPKSTVSAPSTVAFWIGNISPDGKTIVVAFKGSKATGGLLVLDISSTQLLAQIPLLEGRLSEEWRNWAFVGDGKRVAQIDTRTRELQVYDMVSGKFLQQSSELLAPSGLWRTYLSSSLDGKLMASLTSSNKFEGDNPKSYKISVWDTDTLKVREPAISVVVSGMTVQRQGPLSFSADNQYLNLGSHAFSVGANKTALSLEQGWITFNGEKLIHLPVRHRGQNYRMNGGRFVLNTRDGAVISLDVDFSRIGE